MRIGEREIGPDQPPYVIAEIGVNHDGSPERALELTRLAAKAGANAVKFQLFEADRLMSAAAKLAAYQKAAGETDPVEMLRRLELSIDELSPCVGLAHELGIHAIVSVFSVELVAVAERAAWDAYKTASPDIVNKPLLDALAATGRPLIVSTGASTLPEVGRALTWLRASHDHLALLQCVSSYPTPDAHAEIGGMLALRDIFTGPVGYSDHTSGVAAGAVAAAMGATILEKHMTYDPAATGPDHAASLDAAGFERYAMLAALGETAAHGLAPAESPEAWIAAVRARFTRLMPDTDAAALWDNLEPTKRVLFIEQDVRTASRQSLVTTRALAAGHVITREDLTIKRPGTGLPPFELEGVVGKRLKNDVAIDTPVPNDDR